MALEQAKSVVFVDAQSGKKMLLEAGTKEFGNASASGLVKLSDDVNSTLNAANGGTAATPYAVKQAYDKAVSAISGAQTFEGDKTFVDKIIAQGGLQGNVTGDVTGDVTGNCSGNAGTATRLKNARTFLVNLASTKAASFNGTANVTPGITGTLPAAHGGTGRTDGKAVAWANARTLTLSGVVNGSASFDGSRNITIETTQGESGGGGVPTGSIIAYMGQDGTIPSGYLLCNGAAVSRTTYANLFAVIGTKFGTGDGRTTFTLPNLNNRFLEGTTSTPGTAIEAGLPNITGYAEPMRSRYPSTGGVGSGALSVSSVRYRMAADGDATDSYNIRVTINASSSSSIYSASSTVQPSSYYCQYLIKN